MNKKAYDKALGYAYRLNSKLYKDVVHDSYIVWFNKTGHDLFDEDQRVITQVVKKTWQGKYLQKNMYMYRGEKFARSFCNIDDVCSFNMVTKETTKYSDIYNSTKITPEDEMIAKELDQHMTSFKPSVSRYNTNTFIENSAKLCLDMYLYAVQGFTRAEISEITGLNWTTVNNYFQRMQWRASLFN